MRDHRTAGYGLEIEKLPRSKKAAEAIGAVYFYTGKPCKYGHLAARYTKGGSCSQCTRTNNAVRAGRSVEAIGRYTRANLLRTIAAEKGETTYVPEAPCPHGHRLRFTASANCVECDRIARERYAERRKDARVQKLYGLTPEQHEAMFEAQNKSCRICEWEASHRRELHVDHCHTSGAVRGLLCQRCNQAVGLFEDNPHMIRRAADYVEANAPALPREGPS